ELGAMKPAVPFAEEQRYDYDLSAASVVLDVGAFEGTFTRRIRERFGCRVYAFEPVRRHYELLRQLEGPNVRVFNFGIGATDRFETIAICGDGSSIFRESGESETVEIRSLERVLAELELPYVDLLKLNVEGCEYEILEHLLDRGLAERFEHIQVQFHAILPDAETRRDTIRAGLADTHQPTYDHPFVWESHERSTPRHGVAVATLFRDEARHLAEWIEYHRLVGVEHFWLYDDSSRDDWRGVLAPYLAAGLVEVFPWPISEPRFYSGRQVDAQRDALRRACGQARWLALIDVDEFLLPLEDATVTACLDTHFSGASAVYVNWRNFGTGGTHLVREGPILSHLTACAHPLHPRNAVGKSIVRPEHARFDSLWYPHHVVLAPDARYQDGDGQSIPHDETGPRLDGKVHDRLIRLNHYAFRDESYFRSVKLRRSGGPLGEEDLLWEHYEAFSEGEDSTITSFIRDRHPAAYDALCGRPDEAWPKRGPHVSARIYGGLGNNLFQIATASAVAWDNGAEPVFPELSPSSPRYQHVFLRCNRGPDRDDWLEWREPSYAHSPIPFRPNVQLVGYFQSEKYFAHHRPRLVDLFRPSPSAAAELRSAYGDLLARPETVGVQLRYYRDDDPDGSIYPQYGEEYLERAAAFFPRTALFVVSTNNLDFARANLPPRMKHAVLLEGTADHIDLFALSACSDIVITNSSFGWWAAWLNQNPNKRVVRPMVWVYGLPSGDVCPEEWIAVDAAAA
ncbi:MAG: FkbM family methyltransferase, partial [Gaiellaceae bacterium]